MYMISHVVGRILARPFVNMLRRDIFQRLLKFRNAVPYLHCSNEGMRHEDEGRF
ncbi:hypothetical protein QO002_001779 [Pararhizobium capsulatum DSM 1112]|uniref:Uncharacterized protein n=1 Tax=Pararhizobium capsulatum DSM 1112 TaxID=1121113 RepID=A0ABU0BPN9_9HYPH|nr:hypothetical protein [Pararhizobium capsulatum DSM 1112]